MSNSSAMSTENDYDWTDISVTDEWLELKINVPQLTGTRETEE